MANGSIAAGTNAFASNGGAAFDDESSASGLDSSAIGSNSTASHANAAAFGNGATTTRANQQAFGTASNTYTMAGVTSAGSKTAQGAPTQIVTSNDSGDLASYTFAELGLVTPSDLSSFATKGDVAGLQSQIDHLGKRDNQLTEGLAAVVALAQPILDPGQSFGITAAWGGFDDANAIGVSAAGVLARNLLRPGSGTLACSEASASARARARSPAARAHPSAGEGGAAGHRVLPGALWAYACEKPFNGHATCEAERDNQVVRHERGASAFILRVGVPRDPKQERHFVYWVASYRPRLPDPRCKRGTILPWRYAAPSRRCYCGSAPGSGHSKLAHILEQQIPRADCSCP